MKKKKFYITTTIALSFIFFKGQPRRWKELFDVCALSAEHDRLKEFAGKEGIRYKFLPLQRKISLWSDFMCLLRYVWIFIKDRPYIVHGNTPKASLLSMVAAWITCRPIRIYMCHGLRYQGTKGWLCKLLMRMEKIACSCATHVVCVSKGVAETMIADNLCCKDKVRVVGAGSAGGIDMELFNPWKVDSSIRNDLGIPEDAFVFCFVGRIVKDKGINELIAAFEKLNISYSNLHLLLVGPMEKEQNPIDAKSSAIIESNTHIYAVGMQKDVRPYLKASDAFVFPSYREGFGMVLIEAGAMGLPCITTNITGCNEIVISGVNGAIVKPRNDEELYLEMKRWIDNPSIVKKMSRNVRKMVKERYECHKVWDDYFNFYKSLIV